MPESKRLKDFLNKNGVKFISIKHSQAYTAQEVAATAHIPGQELAKTVIINSDGTYIMVVLPSTDKVDFDKLKKVLDVQDVRLATEDEFKWMFPECEIGAMPPFGNLYDIPVYASTTLADDEEIVFNAGNHTQLIRMKYADFERLVGPALIDISKHT